MKHRLALSAFVWLAALIVTDAASAHAKVSPSVVQAKDSEVFTLAVPTEKKNATTTTIEFTPTKGFGIDSFFPSPGWKRSVQTTGSGENAVVPTLGGGGGTSTLDIVAIALAAVALILAGAGLLARGGRSLA